MDKMGGAGLCTLALDATPSAVILVDDNCLLRYANGRARAILERGDGLALDGAKVTAVGEADGAALRRAVKGFCGQQPSGAVNSAALAIQREVSRYPLLLRFMSPGRGACIGGRREPTVLVFVGDPDPEHCDIDLELLQRLHGLTEREAALAHWLARDKRLTEVAEVMGITYNTARDHLRSVMSKTGVGTQAALARLVWCSPAWR